MKQPCVNCGTPVNVRKKSITRYCQKPECRSLYSKERRMAKRLGKTVGEVAYQLQYSRQWNLPKPTKTAVKKAEQRGRVIYRDWLKKEKEHALEVGNQLSPMLEETFGV